MTYFVLYLIVGALACYIAMQLDKEDELDIGWMFLIFFLYPIFICFFVIIAPLMTLDEMRLGDKIMTVLRKLKL